MTIYYNLLIWLFNFKRRMFSSCIKGTCVLQDDRHMDWILKLFVNERRESIEVFPVVCRFLAILATSGRTKLPHYQDWETPSQLSSIHCGVHQREAYQKIHGQVNIQNFQGHDVVGISTASGELSPRLRTLYYKSNHWTRKQPKQQI